MKTHLSQHPWISALWAVAIFFIAASLGASAQTTLNIDDGYRSVATLTNTTVTLSGKSEVHVTGTGTPISGSTIHLNSPDCWLFFDNIRPATADDWLGQIKVNGAAAVHGSNVRVVQYAMGTVITPFTNTEQPLQTFTNASFEGDSKLYSLYTYYDSAGDLGVMHRNISSFKLKRGFMATFATQGNGSGVSKVYVAQDHDLNIPYLPGNLDNAIQFVRVFPWRWVSKKGSCDVSADVLNAAWYYNWNNDQNSTLNWEYVPIRQQRFWPAYPTNKPSVTHLLGYNEPNNPVEDAYTSLNNGDVDAAIAAWPELLATGLRVGSPAVTDGGKAWLYEFMDKANAAGLRVDYIAIHNYQCGNSASSLKSWLQDIWDRYHKPIWLTEFNNGANWTNCGDPTTDQNATVIGSFIDMMDNTSWIERYAVYSNVEWQRNMTWNASWSGSSGLTPAGVVYRDNHSPIGYQQEDQPAAVDRGVARLTFDGNTRDSSGYDNRGISYGTPVYVQGQSGQALQFDGSLHLKMPTALLNDNDAFTFAAWVNWDGGGNWQRIFDFGTGTDAYLFLSPSTGTTMRFAIKNGGAEQIVETAALPIGQWTHVAVTVGGGAAKLYVNGSLAATNNAVTLVPSAIAPNLNYLGKSQFADPLFRGRLDEIILADAAWTQEQIASLMTSIPSPFRTHWRGDVGATWTTNNSGNTNWSNATGATDAGQIPGVGTEVVFSATTAGSPANTVLGANVTINGLSVITTAPVGIGGSHHLTLGEPGIDLASGAGATVINTTGEVKLAVGQTWTNNSANPLTVHSPISGTGNLIKDGTGTLALAGPNLFSGGTGLWAGTVALGHNTALGSGTIDLRGATIQSLDANARTVGNAISFSADTIFAGTGALLFTGPVNAGNLSKTFTVNNARTEFSGVISGGGARTKAGAGELVLSGANTYTGATTVNAGTLTVNGSLAAASAVTVASGATLTGIGNVKGTVAFAAGSKTLWSLAANQAVAGKLTTGATTVAAGTPIALVFNRAGSTVNFTDPFWSQPRSWQIFSSSGMTGTFTLGSVSNDSAGHAITDYGSIRLQQTTTGVTLSYSPFGVDPPPAPANFAALASPGQVSLSWALVTGAETYNVWRATHSDGPFTAIATGLTGTSFTDLSGANGTGYYYVVTSVNPNGESNPAPAVFATPHLPSIIDKADNAVALNQIDSWLGGTLPGELDVARWSAASGANSSPLGTNLSLSGVAVVDPSSPASIATGNTLTLGWNGVDLSQATQNFTISAGLQLGAGQTWKVASGRTLAVNGAFSRTTGSTLLVDRSTGNGTVSAAIPLSDGILGPWAAIKSAGTAANGGSGGFTYATILGGGVVPYTGATPLTNTLWTAPGANTVNYDISGAGLNMGVSRVAKTLRYTGSAATTYTVGSGATLTINGLMNAGGGLWTYNPGMVIGSTNNHELVLNSGNAGLTLNGVIANGSVPGTVTIAGQNTVTFTASHTYTGGTHVSSGKLVSPPDALNAGAIAIAGGATLTFSGNNQTCASGVSGNGAILNDSANNTVFTGDHSGFKGSFTHSAASNNTQFNSATSGSSKASYHLSAGELIFALNGNYTVKMGSLATTGGNVRGGNSATGTTTLEIGGRGTSTSIAGNLNNGTTKVIALAKVGAGTLTLLGTNNYSGGTQIQGGTLMVNGVLTGNGLLTVGGGAALQGAGTLNGPVTVASGGTLAAGNNAPGLLTLSGALTLGDGSNLNVGIGATASRVTVGGPLAANGITTVNLSALAGFGPGTYPLLSATAPINAASFTVGATPDGYACSLEASGNNLSVSVTALPPAAPTALSAIAGNGTVSLTWNASSGAASYQVKRSLAGGANYTTLTSVTTTGFTDSGLTNGTTYYYVVTALNPGGESDPSNEASATAEGVAETWRQSHFGTSTNSGDASDDADPDGDDLVNLLERAFGTNPNAREPGALPAIDPAAPMLSITYRKAKAATDLVFVVQESGTLEANSWTPATGTSEVLSDDGVVQTIRFTAPANSAATKFLRLGVSKP